MTDAPRVATPQRGDLPALTTLRFFAAFYVVLFHGAEHYLDHPLWRSFVGTGFIAVDFFFVLSGFVLAYRYSSATGDLEVSNRRFWWARVARIVPVYVLSIAIAGPQFISALTHSAHGTAFLTKALVSLVMCLLFVQAWFYRVAGSWNGPGWTLSVEAFLYAAFPAMSPRIARWSRAWGAAVVIFALWLLAMALPSLYMLLRPDGPGQITAHSPGAYLSTLRYMPLVHLPSFLIGATAGWSFQHQKRVVGPRLALGTSVVLFVGLLFSAWLPYPHLHAGLFAPLFVIVIWWAASSAGTVTGFLGSRPLRLLGDASYSLYLLHYPLLVYAQDLNGGPLSVGEFVAFCVIVQVLSIASYKLVEVPCRRWLRQR